MATQLKTKWIQDLAITTAKLDATSVTAAKLALDVYGFGLDATAGTALKIKTDGTSLSVGPSGIKVSVGGIEASMLAPGIISGGTIVDGAITTAKLADRAVTIQKLGSVAGNGLTGSDGTNNLAVLADSTSISVSSFGIKITDSGVTTGKIADLAVTTAKIADLNVTTGKIADQAVTTAKVGDRSITIAKLDSGVAGNGLTSADGTNAIAVMADGTSLSVGPLGVKITAAGIDSAMIANGAVTGTQLAASVAGNGLSGGAGAPLSVNVDNDTIEINANTLRVKALGITANELDATSVTNTKLDGSVYGNGVVQGAPGTAITVLADGTGIAVSATGIKIAASGIDMAMIAGVIPDSKLATITTANKVMASAVEDRFIRNDADDTSIGRIQANGFDANSNRISRVSDATSNSDAVNLGQVNSIVTAGRLWKETLLYKGQLFNDAAGGISAANVVTLTSNFVSGDVITLSDTTFTQDYTAVPSGATGLQFNIGGTISASLINLGAGINAGPVALSATSHLLDTIDSTNEVLIVFGDAILVQDHRIWGNASAATRAKILPTSKLYEGIAADLIPVPTVDPVTTNFGFQRIETALVTAETHYVRENDAAYTWDSSALKWNITGATGLPYATKTDYGKVQISDGISVAAGIIAVEADAVGGANLSRSINVTPNGVAIKVDAATIEEGTGQQLRVKDGGITGAKLDSTSVSTSKIVDLAVTTAKIADLNVTTAKIADGAVTAIKLDATSVTTAKIVDLNVTTGKINDLAVTTAKLADGAVTAIKLDATSVTTAKIVDLNVTRDKIAVSAINASKIDATAVTASALDLTVYGNGLVHTAATALTVLADGTSLIVGANGVKIKNAGIDSTMIANGAITTTNIATNAVTFPKILTDSSASGLKDNGSGGVAVKLKVGGGLYVDSTGIYMEAQVPVHAFFSENHVILSGEVTAKSFTLADIPSDASSVALTILGGVQQTYGTDYVVTGTTVSWNGLGLDGWIATSDVAYLTYPVLEP